MKKTLLAPLAAGIALALAPAIARADFEMWKNKDGKAAELEITGLDEGTAGTQVRFRTKAGKEVLSPDDQGRAKAWKAHPPVSATFGYATNRPGPPVLVQSGTPGLQFVFDLKGQSAMALSPLKISNPTLRIAGKTLEVTKWSGMVDDGTSEADPFATPPSAWPVRKWSLVVIAEGDFGNVVPQACEFSADVEVSCGKSPKEITTTLPLPKADKFDDDEGLQDTEKIVEPITIKVGTAFWPLPGKKDKDDGVVTGYHLVVVTNAEKVDLNAGAAEPVFSQAFVAKGKEYPNAIYKMNATNPVTIVVKYWSESFKVPLHLSKAASNKGRTPPPAPKPDAAAGGGADPFGG